MMVLPGWLPSIVLRVLLWVLDMAPILHTIIL